MSKKSFGDRLEEAQQQNEDLHTLPPALTTPPKKDAGRKTIRYPSEAARSKATYDLDQATIEGVKGIAAKERLPRGNSKVAAALLAWAVGEYEAGKIGLQLEQRGPDWWLEVVQDE